MDAGDRKFFGRIQDIIHDMANMAPSNPCDTKAKFDRFDKLVRASNHLYKAIACHGFGDFDDAAEHLGQAQAAIDRKTIYPY